jgi:DNA-binding transcriptional ArsR family regulator
MSTPDGAAPRLTIRDPKLMRALAHPARVAVLEVLSDGRSSTATELAEACGLSPSAMSYHLRAMDRVGLIQEAPGRGDARERLWRLPEPGLHFAIDSGSSATADQVQAASELANVILDRDDAAARAYIARSFEEPPEWRDAIAWATTQLLVTAAELTEINDAVDRVLEPYRRAVRRGNAPEGARLLLAVFRTVPRELMPGAGPTSADEDLPDEM